MSCRNTIRAMIALSSVSASVQTLIEPTGPITSTVASDMVLEGCAATCMPSLCTGDATMNGAVSRLTYLCLPKTRLTTTITITQTVVFTPTETAIVTEVPGSVSFSVLDSMSSSEPEPTTTVTLYKTATIFKTRTLQRPTSSFIEVPTLIATSESVVIQTSNSIASETSAPPFVLPSSFYPEQTDEPTMTTTLTLSYSTTETIVQTIILTPLPVLPLVFPTLTLSVNGTTTDGIFYSRPLGGNSSVCATDTGYASRYLEARDNYAVTAVNATTTHMSTSKEHHHDHPTSTPSAAYPGAVTAGIGGTGDAEGKQVNLAALFGVAVIAALIL